MSKKVKNGAEAKIYPNTTISLDNALQLLKFKNDSMGPSTILSQKSIDRLNAITPAYKQARLNVFILKGKRQDIVAQKDKACTDLAMYTSHFVQVFTLGIKRGKYLAGDRALFQVPTGSDVLPNLKGEGNIYEAAKWVVSGEAKRIADGKPAMVDPSGAEVEAKFNLFEQLNILASNTNSALSIAQKELRQLHKEARAVVKRIWREVEIFYGEGDRERMRKMAREWSVHYVRKGGEKVVSGIVTDAATHLPLTGVRLKFKNGKNKTLSRSDGRFTLKTNLLHAQALIATLSGYSPAEIIIELIEGEESFCEVKMEKE